MFGGGRARVGVAAVSDRVEDGSEDEVRRETVELHGKKPRRLGRGKFGARAGQRGGIFLGRGRLVRLLRTGIRGSGTGSRRRDDECLISAVGIGGSRSIV